MPNRVRIQFPITQAAGAGGGEMFYWIAQYRSDVYAASVGLNLATVLNGWGAWGAITGGPFIALYHLYQSAVAGGGDWTGTVTIQLPPSSLRGPDPVERQSGWWFYGGAMYNWLAASQTTPPYQWAGPTNGGGSGLVGAGYDTCWTGFPSRPSSSSVADAVWGRCGSAFPSGFDTAAGLVADTTGRWGGYGSVAPGTDPYTAGYRSVGDDVVFDPDYPNIVVFMRTADVVASISSPGSLPWNYNWPYPNADPTSPIVPTTPGVGTFTAYDVTPADGTTYPLLWTPVDSRSTSGFAGGSIGGSTVTGALAATRSMYARLDLTTTPPPPPVPSAVQGVLGASSGLVRVG